MNNRQTLIQQIRFGISQLSAQNGSLQFEHICRHLSRLRICSNILPATGPVQAGGDQGRDFETFHTYLKQSPLAETSFLGLISKNPIAFACSLEKNPTKKNGKIEKDVKTILSSGVVVDRIYFFSGEDIPVAKRHKLIDKTKQELNVTLEILDANGISELLADSDLFWIANQYLSIPSEFFPRPEKSADWYEQLVLNYKESGNFDLTFEAFQDIKIALRHIYKDTELKVDLPFWIIRMDRFISETERTIPVLSHRAIYEIFVASLIGMDDIRNQENNVRQYFSKLDQLFTQAEFTDATCLMSFVSASSQRHQTTFSIEKIEVWKKKLIDLTDQNIQLSKNENLLCTLHELKFQQYTNGIRLQANSWEEFQEAHSLGVEELKKILPLIPQAPFYSVEGLSKNINHFIKLFIELGIMSEDLEDIAYQVDEFYGQRIGEIEAAENLRNRAMLYMEHNNEIMAIKILHKAKIKWANKESQGALILTLIMLAECYHTLKLTFAAKYYAFAAAHHSLREQDAELMPYYIEAMKKLASIEYSHGAWINYFNVLDTLLPVTLAVKKDFDLEKEHDITAHLVQAAIAKYISQRFGLRLINEIDLKISKLNWLAEEVNNAYTVVKNQYDKSSEDLLWNRITEELYFKPFNDVGNKRNVIFNSYGINWKFSFQNDYLTNALAEQAIAIIQIFLVEIAGIDLHLLNSGVEVEIKVSTNELKFEKTPSNDVCAWVLHLPIQENFTKEYIHDEILLKHHLFSVSIIRELSLLKQVDFDKKIKMLLTKGGLQSNTFFGRTYYDYFMRNQAESTFNESKRNSFKPPFKNKSFTTTNHELLDWKNKLSVLFDKEEIIGSIKGRYIKSFQAVEITSKTLFQDDNFKNNIKILRREGWLDWQILMTLANIAVSFRIEQKYGNDISKVPREKYMTIFLTPEKDNYIPIPMSNFSLDRMRHQMNVMLVTLLPSYQLEVHTQTPVFLAIRVFLNQRFQLDQLDIPNMSPFEF